MYKHLKQNNPKLLVPTLSEVILYPLVSFVLLCIFVSNRLIDSFGLGISTVDLPAKLAVFYENIIANLLPGLVNALLWAIVGMSVYFIMWITVDSITKINEINTRLHRFIYPSKEAKHVFVFTIIGQLCLRFVSLAALIAWTFLLIKIISPVADYFYKDAWTTGLFLAPLILGAYFFVGAVIIRFIVLQPRVFSDTK